MGYLTPNAIPSDTTCRSLFIPNNQEFIAVVLGALQTLTIADYWTKFGTLTPEEAAMAMVDMFDGISFSEGTCRMVGEIVIYSGISVPDVRWITCDGRSLLRASYPDLFTVIGTQYGFADGSHFNIPNLQDRVAVGAGNIYTEGDSGGEATHTLITSEIPSHQHSGIPTFIDTAAGLEPLLASAEVPIISANTGFTGGDGSHNNLQPYLALNYLIVALP